MEDPAEIAALCQEYIGSLDNTPHEVTHILKEIQHKDNKVQELLPKLQSRETQLRELLNKGSPGAPASAGGTVGATANSSSNSSSNLNEQDKAKAEKLLERIKQDYRRVDEWSSHKELLSTRLWRIVHGHNERLKETFEKVSPAVMNIAESNVAMSHHGTTTPATIINASKAAGGGSSILGAIASAFGIGGMPALTGGAGRMSAGDDYASGGLKRKAASGLSLSTGMASPSIVRPLSSTPGPKAGRQGSAETPTLAAGLGSPSTSGYQLETPSRGTLGASASSLGRPRKSGGGSLKSRPSALSNRADLVDNTLDAGFDLDDSLVNGTLAAGLEGEEADEKDETLYCFCQKVSYGEMIGCDNDDCKYEWFHLDCVGLCKPLPQVWYCSDCQQRMKKEKEAKKEGSVGVDGRSQKKRKK